MRIGEIVPLTSTDILMTINCKGTLIDLNIPRVMGILNLTPDSFYDGGRYAGEKGMLQQVERMLDEGATFIDLGAYSSRPGASFVSEDEELQRLLPVLQRIVSHFPQVLLSIDTFRASVAQKAIQAGAALINDISGGQQDEGMLEAVRALQVPYIMMHMRGTPETMQSLTTYDDIMGNLIDYFTMQLNKAKLLGINDVIIDPGFGFAKTIPQNYEVLRLMKRFRLLEVPILGGLSRKSMIYKPLETSPAEALNGTTALNMVALNNGASILRVHDVKEAVECIRLGRIL